MRAAVQPEALPSPRAHVEASIHASAPAGARRSPTALAGEIPAIVMLALAGCHRGHDQSALHPASAEAASIATLWWVMFGVLAVAFVIVIALALFAISRRAQSRTAPGGSARFVVVSGIVVPSIILVGLLVYSLHTSQQLRRPAEGRVIQVTGFQWWWEVRYPDLGIITANEIHLPAGEPVRLELRAKDVVHSFWVPNLHGKIDLLPETVNTIRIRADEPGTWRGICAEFCGRQHALMGLRVVALTPPDFDRWAEERRPPARPTPTTEIRRGEEVFFESSCHVCHAVRGTRAVGRIGPDLTHLASRLTLGAGAVENNRERLAAWVLDPHAIKPGNLMPRTPLSPDDLEALLDYLQTLR